MMLLILKCFLWWVMITLGISFVVKFARNQGIPLFIWAVPIAVGVALAVLEGWMQ